MNAGILQGVAKSGLCSNGTCSKISDKQGKTLPFTTCLYRLIYFRIHNKIVPLSVINKNNSNQEKKSLKRYNPIPRFQRLLEVSSSCPV